jgi:hypothetical protein
MFGSPSSLRKKRTLYSSGAQMRAFVGFYMKNTIILPKEKGLAFARHTPLQSVLAYA